MKIILKSCFCGFIIGLFFVFTHSSGNPQTSKPNSEMWQKILTLEGKDFSQLDRKTYLEIISFLESVVPTERNIKPSVVGRATPPIHYLHSFWKIGNPQEPARYIFVGADGLRIIPGDSRAEAFVYNEEGNLLSYTEFSLGWREQFKEVKLIKSSHLEMPLIEIITDYSDWGSEQYFALINDRLALIRLEGKGKTARNSFVATNWTKGPRIPVRTSEEWEQALHSNNPAEILNTLIWVGGKHWDLKIEFHRPSDEVRKNAELVLEVRVRDSVKARLQELSKSENLWIREAAELALNPHDGDTSICCGPASK